MSVKLVTDRTSYIDVETQLELDIKNSKFECTFSR